jgi:YihY family inner membrane protein
VQRKYSDDRGGQLSALVAYYGFLSLFPCLLVFLTVTAYVLRSHPSLQRSLETSALGQFPVIGPTLRGHLLHGNVVAVALGSLGLLWGAQGVSRTVQFAMFEMWNVRAWQRPGFFPGLRRSGLLFAILGAGVALTTFLSSLGEVLHWGPAGSVLAALPATVFSVALFLVSFKVLSPAEVGWRDLLPGAASAAVCWQALQTVGVNLVRHQVAHASELYGSIGTVIGAIGFLYIAARLTVYSAELNVVLRKRLWPRSLAPPPLVEADKRELVEIAEREQRRQEQRVTVQF